MAFITPKINKIIRMTEFDLLRTSIKQGDMYMCLDTQKLYYDQTSSQRNVYDYIGVKTINDLLHHITPALNRTYYCWEDNSLWIWQNKWVTLFSSTVYPSAYIYDSNKNLSEVFRYDQPNFPADDNGLLKDGSVVIRDRQRIIKGKIMIDDNNDNLVISSYLGGGVRILPNGAIDTNGELLIDDDGKSHLRSQWNILNNEMYVDYSEKPSQDKSEYPNSEHRYKVYHEGNLDASAIKVLTPEDIYNKLLDSSLPNPLNFNVTKLNGKTPEDFAPKVHNHKSSEITDFNIASRGQAKIEIKQVFDTMIGEGIAISYDPISTAFKIKANSFNLTFTNGVVGEALVDTLSDTTINLEVDPNKHIHQNYIDRMTNLQDQINKLDLMDPADYYDKINIDKIIDNIKGTVAPEKGKPLLVNNEGKLPAPALSADKFTTMKTIQYTGDITGSISTDFSDVTTNIQLDSSNVISSVPTANKALKLDKDLILQAKAKEAKYLDHTIDLSLSGEAIATGTLDTSLKALDLNIRLNPSQNIIQDKDIGKRVAGLNENGIVPVDQLPAVKPAIYPMSTFDPNNGLPSKTPKEGEFWVAISEGTLESKLYQPGDWCMYLNSSWVNINTSDNVITINDKKGKVKLTYSDVNAISNEYINYPSDAPIPNNHIVLTTSDGEVSGLAVERFIKPFKLLSNSSGDVIFNSTSENISTNGSKDFNVKMTLTDSGINKIKSTTGYVIKNNNKSLEHKPNLNFSDSFKLLNNIDATDIELNNGLEDIAYVYWDPNSNTDKVQANIANLYKNRSNRPIIIKAIYDKKIFTYLIDSNQSDISKSLTSITLEPDHFVTSIDSTDPSQVKINNDIFRLKIDFDASALPDLVISDLTIIKSQELLSKFLSLFGDAKTIPYNPEFPCQPATKNYVDELEKARKYSAVIGDGTRKEFTVDHKLNTEDVFIILRDTNTNQQIYADNIIVNKNSITIRLTNTPLPNSIKVIISKL